MGASLDARYDIPSYRSDPVDIYKFVNENRRDPAFTVRLLSDLYKDCWVKSSDARISFGN